MVQTLFGQVWIGASYDGRSIYLASEKRGSISFDMFLTLLQSSSKEEQAYRHAVPIPRSGYSRLPQSAPTGILQNANQRKAGVVSNVP
jgi:hypothetical protein